MEKGKSTIAGEPVELSLPEFHTPPSDPIALFNSWYKRAVEHPVQEPNALALATIDGQGRVWSRTIRIIKVTDAGLLFTSHAGSAKGSHLANNPWASGLLYWPELKQQVTVAGPVERVPDSESDALWAARPLFTHAMSSVSKQSELLEDEDALRSEAKRLTDKGEALPRPAGFCGFRMSLQALEFWHDGEDRLHLRLRYDWVDGSWTNVRLQP